MSTATSPTLLCDYCNSETDSKDETIDTTWQQWQCPHCGSWNDWSGTVQDNRLKPGLRSDK